MAQDNELIDPALPDAEDRAAHAFLRRRSAQWSAADESRLEAQLTNDPVQADALRRVESSWSTVGQHAASPELMALREQALARARRSSAQRWSRPVARLGQWRIAAGFCLLALTCAVAWQLSPFGYRSGTYSTQTGEQRSLELDDHSRISLDAQTRLRVRYTAEARVIELLQGQAQFSVARDPARPFKVLAGGRAIIALGTVFNVEYLGRDVNVAMLEGRVAVLRAADARVAGVELTVGESLRIRADGQTAVNRHADLEAVTAWREGKVVFNNEPLSEALRRLNRYSRLKLEVGDPELAQLRVSGVFEAGDALAFADAVQTYLPVVVDDRDPEVIRLLPRKD